MRFLSVLYDVFILLCFITVYVSSKAAKERQRTIFSDLLLLLLTAGLVAGFFNLYRLLAGGSGIWTGSLDSLLLVLLIAYVISRYRMEEAVVIVRKGIIYGILTAVLSAVYLTAIYILNSFFKSLTGYGMVWVTLPLMFGLAMFFQPLKDRVQASIDKYFFKTKYEADKIRAKFTVGISKLMEVEDLAEYINRIALRTFKLSGSAVFIYDEDRGKYFCRDGRGTLSSLKGTDISGNSEMISYARKTGGVFVRRELESMMKGYKSSSSIFKAVLDEMKALNAKIFVPSISGRKEYKLVGFLIADEKKSQDRFTAEDILLLETIANQAVVNIENAVLYQARLDARRRYLQAQRLSELGSAAARVARQARSAMAPIINFSEQFRSRWNDDAFLDNAQEFLPFEVERLRLILMGILEYSKESAFKVEKLGLSQMLDGMYKIIAFQARNRNVVLEKDIPEDVEINADKDRTRHVLLNLFINALDAMPYGGRLKVSARQHDGKVVVRVSDTGTGVTESIKKKIFDPFFTTKNEAIGLGLSIVKKIVEGHKGTISVESPASELEGDKGTTFTFDLPAVC